MIKRILTTLTILLPLTAAAQKLIYEKNDSIIIEKILQKHTAASYSHKGEQTLAIANEFIGTEYVANTLENGKAEPLFISCSKLDCTTFVELVTAISLSVTQKETTFASVCKNLEKIRYRGGIHNGYPSRLHYTSWWIADNTAKGLLHEVTHQTKHKEYRLTLNFMSTHPSNYPLLKEDKETQRIISEYEKPFCGTTIKYIPKEILDKGQETLNIRSGDIIALVTTIKGLDVSHVGFARWKGNRLHLLHASSTAGRVIDDKESLFNYQKNKSKQTGIRVIRIK